MRVAVSVTGRERKEGRWAGGVNRPSKRWADRKREDEGTEDMCH
jgi:hypothetical protein